MKKIDHTLFIHMLKTKGITQKAFSEYAKIPYDTVTGWKKKGTVPAYAMVIARDMAYRINLDEEAQKKLQRRYKRGCLRVVSLQPEEEKRIEAAFWGTNYTAGEIIEKVKNGDEKFVKRFYNNLPDSLCRKALSAEVKRDA